LLGSAHVSASRISGWVADPDLDRAAPNLQVRLTLNGEVLREGVADLPRPDVERVRKAPGARGFNFPALALGPAEIRAVAVEARAGADAAWQPVKRAPLPTRRALQYQSFDDARGASRAADNLPALPHATHAHPPSEAPPLKGRAGVDHGSNEG
jgi:hypothetical protein